MSAIVWRRVVGGVALVPIMLIGGTAQAAPPVGVCPSSFDLMNEADLTELVEDLLAEIGLPPELAPDLVAGSLAKADKNADGNVCTKVRPYKGDQNQVIVVDNTARG